MWLVWQFHYTLLKFSECLTHPELPVESSWYSKCQISSQPGHKLMDSIRFLSQGQEVSDEPSAHEAPTSNLCPKPGPTGYHLLWNVNLIFATTSAGKKCALDVMKQWKHGVIRRCVLSRINMEREPSYGEKAGRGVLSQEQPLLRDAIGPLAASLLGTSLCPKSQDLLVSVWAKIVLGPSYFPRAHPHLKPC